MGNKNINSGTITATNVDIGDKYNITNVIEGLSYLLSEYKDHLKKIEEQINLFKPKTALDFLIDLELRVKDVEIHDKNKILSKISFLKGLCKNELNGFSKEDFAKDFINAYKLNPSEKKFKERACVEYLNLDDHDKALILADEILATDEYNKSAWFVKAVNSVDLQLFLKKIPKYVFEEYNFQLAIMYHVLLNHNINFLEDLEKYDLKLNIDFEKYKEITFHNLEAWRIAIDLSINQLLNEYPLKYISGEFFIMEDNPLIKSVFNLIDQYIKKLDDSELKDITNHQKFFYNYIGYLITNSSDYFFGLKEEYDRSAKPQWFYTFTFCQILNHRKDYSTSLEVIFEYEKLEGILNSEFYLFKSALYHLNDKTEEVESVFDDYLKSIEIVEQRNGLNILNTFFNIFYRKVSEEILLKQLNKILDKDFKPLQIKNLLEITIRVRFLRKYDYDSTCLVLQDLVIFKEFDSNWKNLIAENLNAIGKRNDAIKFLETYIDKSIVSDSLRLFIILIHAQLRDKNETEKGRYNELLELLKFWRLNNKYVDETLLQYEHNLYTEINDLENLEEIDSYLFNQFPQNKQYVLTYLNILERRKDYSKILNVINSIFVELDDEGFGVSISSILLRNKLDIERGFQILYELALNPNNTLARKNYFFNSLMFNQFFKKYDIVELSCWVSYELAGKIEKIKIEKEEGFQKEFIGKKVGESFTTTNKLFGKIYRLKILEIFNDAINLHHDIINEAKNPLNELGFESFNLPSNTEDFGKFFQEQFGTQGSNERKRREKVLEDYRNYRIGFSEISRSVFRENYIDTYLHLSGFLGNRLTTIPSLITKGIEKEFYQKIDFGLDFSTLILFYFLEKELDFKFIHKFTISYLVKAEIEKEIIELNNSPFSAMTIEITNESIRKYLTPENYREKRQSFLESLLKWIDINCFVDLVKEKLDLLPKFDANEKLDDFMKIIVDNMCLSDRDKFRLISSDSSLFLFTTRNNTISNIINPEKYLISFYPEKCDTSFYRYLLKSNYLGVNINFETLKNEFYDFLVGRENYYNLCLENLQYSINNNPNMINVVSKFLKEIYLMSSLTIEIKNRYAFTLIINVISGMPRDLVIKFRSKIIEDFKIMGNFNDEVQKVFLSVITPPPNI